MLGRKIEGGYWVFVGVDAVSTEDVLRCGRDVFIKLIFAMFFEGFDRINKI